MKRLFFTFALAAGASLVALNHSVYAQGSAFTYQGRLIANGSPANGSYDLTFALFTDSNGVNQVGGTLTNSAVAISNGLFTAALNFDPSVFNGSALWLGISVATNGSGGFTTLAPLQPLTPTPYAIYATSASMATTATYVLGEGLMLTNVVAQASHATNADYATSSSMATTATYVLGEGLMLTNVVAQASHATNADYASVASGLAAGATLNPADAWALTNINSGNVVTATNSTPIGVTVDFSIRESTTSPAGNIAFTAISNWNPTNYNWAIVHVLAQGADCTVTFAPGWRTSGGPCIVTNGTMKDFLFTCQINVFTNAQWISAY